MTLEYLQNGNPDAPNRLILAHGAGAPMDSPFMDFFAEKLGSDDLHVIRFEFEYMRRRRAEGTKRPPDRQPKLLDCWQQVISDWSDGARLFIGGKSMGGRMASLIADEAGVSGLICLGYPFYAPGKQDKPRVEHLVELKTPTLIVQGTRDTMGNLEAVPSYDLSSNIRLNWLEDGDHSFKPRKASGRTEEQNWREGCEAVSGFISAVSS